ncbi:MAG TPA: hypothetical protein VIF09_25835 [Polyangiaceae bacterium]|jgi:hypothetical protein
MRTSRLAVVALLAASTLATTGCKRLAEKAAEKAEEKAIERAAGAKGVQINSNGQGSMTVVTDAGTVMLGSGAKIPEDFPKEVPVYPGASPTASIKTSEGARPAWTLTFETTDSKDKVAAYYKANLSGFTQKSAMDLGQASILVYSSAKYDVSLTANQQGPKTEILLAVSGK